MSQQNERRSLVDVFGQKMQQTDHDMPVAFIAVLHELDQRQRLVEDDLDENARLFKLMGDILSSVSDQQNKLPGRLRGISENALNEALRSIRRESHDGAERGARPTTGAVEALKRASEGYDDRKRWLTYLAAFGLSVAFCGALVLGLLFGNFAISALPAQWQWTCRIIGTEHITQSDGRSFCVVRKD